MSGYKVVFNEVVAHYGVKQSTMIIMLRDDIVSFDTDRTLPHDKISKSLFRILNCHVGSGTIDRLKKML